MKRAENVLLEQVCQWMQMFLQESGFLTGRQEDVHIQGVLDMNFPILWKREKKCANIYKRD